MMIELGLTDELVNTQYGPLVALCAHYQENGTLAAMEQVRIPMKRREFSPASKLLQVLVSILAGCQKLSEVNGRLRPEWGLASVWHWDRFLDQSNLSRTLDALTLMNIEQLRQSVTQIWQEHSQARRHDWRGYLWLDFDLSGLPCSAQAEASQKGYFSGKKTSLDASWHGSAP